MIGEVRVKNFKSLKNISLELRSRNVFVGPNMSGKSNLLDVFHFLCRLSTPAQHGVRGVSSALALVGGTFSDVGEQSGAISIELSGSFAESNVGRLVPLGTWSEWKYEITLLGHPHYGEMIEREELYFSGLDGPVELISRTPDGGRSLRNPDGSQVGNIGDPARSVLEYDVLNWEGQRFTQLIRSWRFYHLVPRLMKQPNQTAAVDFLMENGDNLSAWLMTLQTRYGRSFHRITSAARDVFPELSDIFTAPTQQATVSVSSRERHLRGPIGVWQMSDGELCFLALLSLIYSPRELRAGLYCFEEPENYLHVKLIEQLMNLLRQAQDDSDAPGLPQILLTTHSPHLIDQTDLDDLIVVERRDGATHCSRPGRKRQLKELLMREDVGLGALYYSGALSGTE